MSQCQADASLSSLRSRQSGGDRQTLDAVTQVTRVGVAGHSRPDTVTVKGSATVTSFLPQHVRPALLGSGPSRSRGFGLAFKPQINSRQTHVVSSFSVTQGRGQKLNDLSLRSCERSKLFKLCPHVEERSNYALTL